MPGPEKIVQLGLCALVALAAGCDGAGAAYEQDAAPATRVEIVAPDIPGAGAAESGGGPCTTSCSLSKHAIAPLSEIQFEEAMEAYGSAPVRQASAALDTLLFYGRRTTELLDKVGVRSASKDHVAYLRKELARTHARVSIRMVDAAGRVRIRVDSARVPLGIKQHLHPDEHGELQALTINGTVMRTGLYHLWSRY